MADRFSETGEDGRFMILEHKATQIRKLLLGALLLAKDTWKDELLSSPEGLDVTGTIEEAEEEFAETGRVGPMERLDSALSVINTRARAIVTVIDYLAQRRQG